MFVEMNTRQLRSYYVVELLLQTNSLNRILCVPSTWIRWQSMECETVLVAYPDEPWEVTEERAKIYEDPGENWNMYLAQVKGSLDSFVNVIRHVKEEDRRVAGLSGSNVIVSNSRSPSCSLSPIASLSPGMNGSNTYLSEHHKWRPTGFPMTLIDKSTKSHSEASQCLSGQENDDSGPYDLSINCPGKNSSSPETSPSLGRGANNLVKPANDFSSWQTLKHQEYSPGLVELVDDTGVYIGKKELDDCLAVSKKCTQLAHLLTKHIFSESALRNCKYVGKVRSKLHFRLNEHATTVISNYVLSHGHMRKWNPSSDRAIKSAMRYVLAAYKKKH